MTAVRTAILPAAGLATRFLPVTKAVPKELLPLGNKPVIHWIVEEAVAAGVEEIVLVISPDKTAIREYFSPAPALDDILQARGKPELLDELNRLLDRVAFTFVVQHEPSGLGHAVLCGRDAVGEEPALVLLGDAVITAEVPVARQLVAVFEQVGNSVLGLEEVPDEKVMSRGIVAAETTPDGFLRVSAVVEKPPVAEAPGNLAISGRYLLTPAVYGYLESAAPRPDGEICLTSGIAGLIADEAVYGCVFDGVRHDTGTPAGYLKLLNTLVTQ